MSFYDFASPGSEAHDAIIAGLLQREQLKRQAMLDELNKQNVQSQMADRDANREIQRQNAASLEEERLAHADERRSKAIAGVTSRLTPGQDITGTDAVDTLPTYLQKTEGGATLPSNQTVGVMQANPQAEAVSEETKASPSQKDASVPERKVYIGTSLQLGLKQLADEVEKSQAAGTPMDQGKVTERAMALGIPASDVKNYVEEMFKRGHQAKLHVIDASGKEVNSIDINSDHDLVHGLPKPGDDSGLPAQGLTPQALDMVAAAYARGDRQTLRSMGWGKASKADKLAIINRAASYDPASGKFADAASPAASPAAAPAPGGGQAPPQATPAINPPNLVRTAAESEAAKKALGNLTDNYAAVEAFSKTATRNTALFNQIKKDVPDWGSKMLNYPVRAISDKILGSTGMTDFQAVRQSLQNEYARLISQPRLQGVLSDSARQEIEGALSPNATIGQLEHALHTFATETENRRLSFAEQIAETKDLLGPAGGPAKPAPAPGAKPSIADLKAKHKLNY